MFEFDFEVIQNQIYNQINCLSYKEYSLYPKVMIKDSIFYYSIKTYHCFENLKKLHYILNGNKIFI